MTRRPKAPTFFGGVAVAFVFAAVGAAVFAATTPWLASSFAIRCIAIALGGAYTLYLLSRSEERTGRIATVVVWCVATTLAAVFASSLPLFLICQVASIWLIRSLYFHGSIVTALADLGLGALALAFAIWAARSSGSVFMSIWCFFLVQALFVALPANIGAKALGDEDSDQPFKRAERSATAAIRRLAANANVNHN
jgi:hypothetical protein